MGQSWEELYAMLMISIWHMDFSFTFIFSSIPINGKKKKKKKKKNPHIQTPFIVKESLN